MSMYADIEEPKHVLEALMGCGKPSPLCFLLILLGNRGVEI